MNTGLGMGQQAEDGWIDYVDNVNTISAAMEKEMHNEVFDLDAYHRAQNAVRVDENGNVLAASAPYDSAEQAALTARLKGQSNEKGPFVIPSQVHSLNTKIRNIFFRQSNT